MESRLLDPTRRIQVEVMVLTPRELEKRQQSGDPFIRNILTYGKTLYAPGEVSVAEVIDESAERLEGCPRALRGGATPEETGFPLQQAVGKSSERVSPG